MQEIHKKGLLVNQSFLKRARGNYLKNEKIKYLIHPKYYQYAQQS